MLLKAYEPNVSGPGILLMIYDASGTEPYCSCIKMVKLWFTNK